MVLSSAVSYSGLPLRPDPTGWFGFLRVEADLAITFIQTAKLYAKQKDSDRVLGHARKALSQIQHCLGNPARYYLTEDEVSSLEKLYAEIAPTLEAACGP